MAEYETFRHRPFEKVRNRKNEAAIDETGGEKVAARGLTGPEGKTVCGVDAYKNLFRSFLSAYPDIKITVEDTIGEGDRIVARRRAAATHTGGEPDLATTDQPLDFTGVAIVRLKDGRIAGARNEMGFLEMFSRIGAASFNFQ